MNVTTPLPGAGPPSVPPFLGIPASSGHQPGAAPVAPAALPASPHTVSPPPPLSAQVAAEGPTVWPRSAQAAAALLVLLALLLVAGHAYLSGRSATRPSKIQSGPTRTVGPNTNRGADANDGEPGAMVPPRKSANKGQNRVPVVGKTHKLGEGDGKIDLNRASAEELQKLPGIGPVMSQRIVDQRKRVRSFQTVDDLRKVPGIGAKTLEKLKPYVRVTGLVAVDEAQ